MQILPRPSPGAYRELEILEATFQRFPFSSSSSGSSIACGNLLEMFTDHGGERRISLGRDPPHSFDQIVFEGERYVHVPIIRESANARNPAR
jgi:hypothetical protein